MAINKAHTSTGTKVVLIVLIVAFVASFISLGAGLFTSGGTTSTSTSSDPLAQLNAQYQPTVAALTSQLQSQPESYTALVALGNTYFDWAAGVQQASQASTSAVGADQPLWVASKDAYARAIKAQKPEPGVSVDYAITLFYTGDTKTAVITAEKVAEENPEFAPAFFNLGIFHQALGQTKEALEAFNQAVTLDPDGKQTNVEYAKQQAAALKSAGSTTTSTTP